MDPPCDCAALRADNAKLRQQLKAVTAIYQSASARLERYRQAASAASAASAVKVGAETPERALSLDAGMVAPMLALGDGAQATPPTQRNGLASGTGSARSSSSFSRANKNPSTMPEKEHRPLATISQNFVTPAPSTAPNLACEALDLTLPASATVRKQSNKKRQFKVAMEEDTEIGADSSAMFATPQPKEKRKKAARKESWINKHADADWVEASPTMPSATAAPAPASSISAQQQGCKIPACCDQCRAYFLTLDNFLLKGENKRSIMERYSRKVHSRKPPATPPYIWEHMPMGDTQTSDQPTPRVRPAPIVELKQRPLRSEVMGKKWWRDT